MLLCCRNSAETTGYMIAGYAVIFGLMLLFDRPGDASTQLRTGPRALEDLQKIMIERSFRPTNAQVGSL
jgi:hypothetical protein